MRWNSRSKLIFGRCMDEIVVDEVEVVNPGGHRVRVGERERRHSSSESSGLRAGVEILGQSAP